MHISKRLEGITGNGSDGWGLFYKARQMKAAGTAITELTIGEHDIRTDKRILDAMHQAALAGHTGYAVVPGEPELRTAVAQRVEARTGVPTTADNVLITAGGQAALFAAHHAVGDPGDKALYLDPYYATYPTTIRSLGLDPVRIELRPEDDFQPKEADLRAAATGAKSLLINSPNNPTGVIYSAETMNGIARVAQDHDLWLISDEVYDTQIWDGQHITPRALPNMAERTLVIGSMSKSHAMTGSRVGWIIGPRDVISHLIDLSTNTNYGVAGFVQMAALHALNMGTGIEAEVATPFRRRREVVMRLIEGQNLIRAIPAQGAMYVMLDCRATGLSGEGFADKLLETHHIAVMPGESFGQAAAGHVRVALTVEDDILERSVATLLEFAQGLARG